MNEVEAAYIAGIIDGEGTITLTRLHKNEYRRPVITIASTDIELLTYLKSIIKGTITSKKNYSPKIHKDSYTLTIKSKENVFYILEKVIPYLRVPMKKRRAEYLLKNYNQVTLRNGKFNDALRKAKLEFEEGFFKL
ncbi:MAG: LAGLIDADG family homing endonuclease [Bacillaceae bacterium]|nr:LAGLIDADG family homing endonuclease [Bacillaceae bacterium]